MIFLILLFFTTVFGSPLNQFLLKQRLTPVGIIGGQDADIADYPYQVAVDIDGDQQCGGSILSNTIIVTAAHCFIDSSLEKIISVRAGSSKRNEGGQAINVTTITPHPDFDFNLGIENDIAVLELGSPLTYGDGVQPIPLADNSTVLVDGQNSTITGWGLTAYNATESSDVLQVTVVPLVTTETCKNYYGDLISSKTICAGGDGKNGCSGDSGGPLVVDGVLQGVLSFGTFDFVLPDGYTRVSEYLDFINPFLK